MTVGLGAAGDRTIEGLASRASELEAMGFTGMWMPNAFGFDAITALAIAARGTDRIEIGTAVVPTYPRHPIVMAQQALTAQAALEGRFTLGIGLSHRAMMEGQMGIPFDQPAKHMREYLSVLGPLLRGEPVSFHGDLLHAEAELSSPPVARVPVIVAALGPAMLRVAGELADGTITSWAGPKALETHIVPRIAKAAAEAGRPMPRIAVGLPIGITEDPAAARQSIAPGVAHYNDLPSYRSLLDIDGARGPEDVALVGTEAQLDAALADLASAGATDFLAQVVSTGPGSVKRTVAYLAEKTRAR
jgi:5,10-methylenetetrahydromethanopterin reductase